MKTRTRIVLATAAVIASSALYGNLRFNFSRYEPQYEHLPGVTLYGKTPQASELQVGTAASYAGPMGVTLRLHYNGRWTDIQGIYGFDLKQPHLINTNVNGKNYADCKPYAPVQVVAGILNRPVVKGSWGYEAAYLGLREIFETPKPVIIDISDAHLPPLPPRHYRPNWGGRDKEPRRLYDSLAVLSRKLQGYAQWDVAMTGRRIATELDSKKPGASLKYYNKEARELISEAKSMRRQTAGKPFWRGWDVLFGAGIVGMMGLFISGLFKRNKTAQNDAELLFRQPTNQKTGDKMNENEKKREELKKLYEKTLDSLYERVEKATSLEECSQIAEEFDRLSDKIHAEDPSLFKSLNEADLRFSDCLDGKIELLGGPKAILR
jgi:hypothetical protein